MEGIVKSLWPQRSPEWFAERLGKFTSSEIYKLLTSGRRSMTAAELAARPPGERRSTVDEMFGDGAITYIYNKLNELTTGEVDDTARGDAIDWGIANEPDAVELYQYRFKVKVNEVGFITYNEFFGGSSDGEVGEADTLENGIIEVKCPYLGANHLKMFRIKSAEQFALEYDKHYAQIQGNLLASGRGWCDFISYDPRQKLNCFKLYVLRIYRDEPFIVNMSERIDAASTILVDQYEELISMASEEMDDIAA